MAQALHLQQQIESQIDACLLHLGYFSTQHSVKLKFKVLTERADKESYPTRIQSFHYGACKWSLYTCVLPCISEFQLLSVPMYKSVFKVGAVEA